MSSVSSLAAVGWNHLRSRSSSAEGSAATCTKMPTISLHRLPCVLVAVILDVWELLLTFS